MHIELDRLIEKASHARSLSAMVLVVMSGLRSLGRRIVAQVLEHRSRELHQRRGQAPSCPHCRRRMYKPQAKETSRMTLLGRLRYRRYRWLCRKCKRSHAPLDSTLVPRPGSPFRVFSPRRAARARRDEGAYPAYSTEKQRCHRRLEPAKPGTNFRDVGLVGWNGN